MIVLDTHSWIWWVGEPDRLSAPARESIDDAAARKDLHISSISVWEAAMLVSKGRLTLTMELGAWIRKCELLPYFRFHPVDNAIAVRSVRLPGDFHSDPADRIIVATALSLNAPVVTRDRKIIDYAHIASIW